MCKRAYKSKKCTSRAAFGQSEKIKHSASISWPTKGPRVGQVKIWSIGIKRCHAFGRNRRSSRTPQLNNLKMALRLAHQYAQCHPSTRMRQMLQPRCPCLSQFRLQTCPCWNRNSITICRTVMWLETRRLYFKQCRITTRREVMTSSITCLWLFTFARAWRMPNISSSWTIITLLPNHQPTTLRTATLSIMMPAIKNSNRSRSRNNKIVCERVTLP